MNQPRDRARRYVMLGLLFAAGALALEFVGNLTSAPIQRFLDRFPPWLHLSVTAVLLGTGVAAAILYERSTRRSSHPPPSTSGAKPIAAARPSRRAMALLGLGAAVTGAATATAGPRMISWLTSISDPMAAETPRQKSPWRYQKLQLVARGNTDLAESAQVVFGPDSKTLAAGFTSGTVVLWNSSTRARRVLLGKANMRDLAFSPDGKLLAAISGGSNCFTADERGSTTLWEFASQKKIAVLDGQYGGDSVAFSPDGKTLACGFRHDCGGPGGVAELWNVETRKKTARIINAEASMAAAAFSPDGTILAAGGEIDDASESSIPGPISAVILWDTSTRKRHATLVHPGLDVRSVVFSPNGTILAATGVGPAGITLWDVAKRESIAAFTVPDETWVSSVAFSPDGKTLAAGLEGNEGVEVALWSMPSRRRLATLDHPQMGVHSLAFSPDGTILAVGGNTGDVHLWTRSH